LVTTGAQSLALEALSDDFYATSSRASIAGRRNCVKRLLAEWGDAPYPITLEKLRRLGAGLHAGGFRSAATILSQYKVDGERRGQQLGPEMVRLSADLVRACRRGQGPPIRAAPLPLERFGELPGGSDPWVPGGPVGPRNALVVGAWWMLREVEAANLRAALVTVVPAIVPTATLHLPASKADSGAAGVSRSHACLCAGSPGPACPVHAAWDQQLVLRARFPARAAAPGSQPSLPFFPDSEGQPVAKAAFAETIRHAARLLGVPLVSPCGTLRVAGHSLRPTGAQGLARLGLDLWAVQLLGRWGSAAVMGYVRDSAAGPEAAVSRRALLGRNLEDLSDAQRRGASAAEIARLALGEVRASIPAFLSDLRKTLLAELRQPPGQALGQAAPPASSSSSADSDTEESDDPAGVDLAAPSPQEQVSSKWTCRLHKVLIGPASTPTPADWTTVCGWRFGGTTGGREPRPNDATCLRCYPLVG